MTNNFVTYNRNQLPAGLMLWVGHSFGSWICHYVGRVGSVLELLIDLKEYHQGKNIQQHAWRCQCLLQWFLSFSPFTSKLVALLIHQTSMWFRAVIHRDSSLSTPFRSNRIQYIDSKKVRRYPLDIYYLILRSSYRDVSCMDLPHYRIIYSLAKGERKLTQEVEGTRKSLMSARRVELLISSCLL